MSFLEKFKNTFLNFNNKNNGPLIDKRTNTNKPIVNKTEIEQPKPKPDYSKVLVMLDNGHGEETPGKRSPDGRLREYAYNREIVALLKTELDKEGIPYYIVVPEIKDIKLKTRAARVNKKYAECISKGIKGFFISVHVNAAKNGIWYSARGWSGWTSKGQTAGDKLADCLYEAAHEVLDHKKIQIRRDKSDGDEDWEANLTLLAETNCPACLTENFFQDNKEDVEYLLSDEGKQDVVKIHLEGIKKYIAKYCK